MSNKANRFNGRRPVLSASAMIALGISDLTRRQAADEEYWERAAEEDLAYFDEQVFGKSTNALFYDMIYEDQWERELDEEAARQREESSFYEPAWAY